MWSKQPKPKNNKSLSVNQIRVKWEENEICAKIAPVKIEICNGIIISNLQNGAIVEGKTDENK